jgi:alpha-glucosidase (family GH31 glycosyl hydrolase)
MNIIHDGQDMSDSPVMTAAVVIESLDSSVLHLKITDANQQRWEAPIVNPDSGKNYHKAYMNAMGLTLNEEPFGIKLVDAKHGEIVADTIGKSLSFKDKYLEMTLKYPTQAFFGLGERVTTDFFLCPDRQDCWYTLWGKDVASPVDDGTGGCKGDYGQQPFYMYQYPSSKLFAGVLVLNSNDQDAHIQKNDDGTADVTHRMVGGIFDIYFFYPGDSEFVMKTYHEFIGRPYLPPFWSLGYHQCRYGWRNLAKVKDVVQKFNQNDLPLDVVWADIDYMKDYADFSVDPTRYAGLKEFVQDLHKDKMYWVPIIDAGFKKDDNDKYYQLGESKGAFIKSAVTKKTLVGKVWPGLAVFLSWYSPFATEIWWIGLSDFYQQVEFDGIWIDMNEVANFCHGECGPVESKSMLRTPIGADPHDPHEFDKLPYRPGNCDLNDKAISMTGYHHSENDFEDKTRKEYNAHSLWNLYEAKATNEFFIEKLKRRPFVLTRSNFPGSGIYTSKWLGDNFSSWEYMRYSIPGIYNYQMFGIPLIGSDMCGFIGNTNEELCARWMQLGAFYPFTRNHNSIDSGDQEPYVFGERVMMATRNAMRQKYSIIRYYYTKLFEVSLYGGSLIRPLFFEFPHDKGTYAKTNYMFMIGSSLLVAPVLHQGSILSYPYCTNEDWYDFRSFKKAYSYNPKVDHGEQIEVAGGFDSVPVLIRGGSIIPFQDAGRITRIESMKMLPMSVLVVPDHNGKATGTMVTDGATSLRTIEDKLYRYLKFDFSMDTKTMTVIVLNDYNAKPNPEEMMTSITVFGADNLASKPVACATTTKDSQVQLDGTYNAETHALTYKKANSEVYWKEVSKVNFGTGC